MNTFEVSSITFVVGAIVGAIVEYKYGSKAVASVGAVVTADVAALKADVAALKAKAEAVAAKV